ncbi:MAG: 5-methylcytosine-specific restriction endonuclease McrA, partial [Phenylobacterium sp.]
MKHIVKNDEPDEFLDHKAQDKMYQRGNPRWNRVRADVKTAIRESLLIEQGYICCYCERPIGRGDCHIEHLK